MKRVLFTLYLLIIVVAAGNVFAQVSHKVSGMIYRDDNQNGLKDGNEEGLDGVALSNGEEIVLSDKKGRYKIELSEYQFLFVIKPSGYSLPLNESGFSTAVFAYYPKGTPEMDGDFFYTMTSIPDEVNFGLIPAQEEENFRVALWGDPQSGGQVDWNHINKLVTEELLVDGNFNFSIVLGDITHDVPEIFSVAAESFKQTGKPVYAVAGNHDRNYTMAEYPLDFTSFRKNFGPDVYAFNYGQTHFIVLNNIRTKEEASKNGEYTSYDALISEKQLRFVEQDLKGVPDNYLVVFCQHVPLFYTKNYGQLREIIKNRRYLLALSAHNHTVHQKFLPLTDNTYLHEMVCGASCGAWWTGELDYEGIPHTRMADGVPPGYMFLDITGNQYELKYKASGRPENEQMQIFVPEPNRWDRGMDIFQNRQDSVWVNVYTGSERTKVFIRIDGADWTEMERSEQADPLMRRWKHLESKGIHVSDMTRPMIKPAPDNSHIWYWKLPGYLSSGSHKIEVKTEDPHCENLYGVRIFTAGGNDY